MTDIRAMALRFAPIFVLNDNEDRLPMDAGKFVASAPLVFRHEDGRDVSYGPIPESVNLGRDDTFAMNAPFRTWEITRPFQKEHRPINLGKRSGFYLDATNVPNASEVDADEAPVYVDIDESEGRVSFWVFYRHSTIPSRFIKTPSLLSRGVSITESSDDAEELLRELREAYPELAEELAARSPDLASAMKPGEIGAERVRLPDVRTLVETVIDFFDADTNLEMPDLHDGDWERVRIDFSSTTPVVEYFQHNKPPATRPLYTGERPRVHVALGSHAAYPPPGRSSIDIANGGSYEIDANQRWVDASSQNWYGFGGAWGRIGRATHATGPLGPGPYKR